MICKVVVSIKNRNVDHFYSYSIPPFLKDIIKCGQRVLVDFNSRYIEAFVIEIVDEENNKLKDIIDIIDIEDIVSEEILELSLIISKKYFISLYEVLNYFIPSYSLDKIKIKIIKNSDKYNYILDKYFKDNNYFYLKIINKKDYKIIKDDLNNNHLLVDYDLIDNTLYEEYFEFIKDQVYKNNKYNEILKYIKKCQICSKEDLKINNLYDRYYLNKLIKNLNIRSFKKEKEYNINICKKEVEDIVLTKEQQDIINKVKLDSYKRYLLFGVAASGKTEVYIKLAKKCLSLGKTVLVITPYIMQSSELASRFYAHFKDNISILHGKLSTKRKYFELKKLKNKEKMICIGTINNLFTNISNLGLIIIDEASDDLYFDRINFIDVAAIRARYLDIPLLLGTATPTLNEVYNATKDDSLLLLNKPYISDKKLNIEIVDMKKEKNKIFSEVFLNNLTNTLNNKNQALIYLNKRGTANYSICLDCGFVPKCNKCGKILSVKDNYLYCNNCHHKLLNYVTCPKCHSLNYKEIGYGTIKLEQDLKELYTNHNILRVDKDNIKINDDYLKYYNDFINQKYDILITTNVLSKGLNFTNLGFVGIVNADMAFYNHQYDASYKAFSNLYQTVTRAARLSNGVAVCQTYNINSKIFTYLKDLDFKSFLKEEFIKRKQLDYPPYSKIKKLEFISNDKIAAFSVAYDFIKIYKDLYIIGPSLDNKRYYDNKYHVILYIKYKNDSEINFLYNYYKDFNYKNVLLKVGEV